MISSTGSFFPAARWAEPQSQFADQLDRFQEISHHRTQLRCKCLNTCLRIRSALLG